MPEPGVFHNCLIVSIRKRYPKHAQKVMNAIWGAHLLSLTKLIVVVDDDCDVHDYAEVALRAFGNVDYSRDLLLTEGPVDHLDHASYQQFWGGKAGIDATRKLPSEGYTRGWPDEAVMSPGDRGEGRPALAGVRAVTGTSRRREAARAAEAGRIRAFLRLVTIEHSVFALPFAYLSALTAMRVTTGRVDWVDLALVTVAMVAARTFAMAANRIIDRHIDARNPRTAEPRTGDRGGERPYRLAPAPLVALAVFLAAARALNPLCLALAPLAVVPLVVYPYGKRFTNWPHALLALAQAVGAGRRAGSP